jgi:Tfp pilus assembly protein PilN
LVVANNALSVKTVDFPLERAGVTRTESDLRRLTRLLRESALLLEASSSSTDSEFRSGSIDLAVRTMRAASIAIERSTERAAPSQALAQARIVEGPWPAGS